MVYAREGEDLKKHTGFALAVFERIKDRFVRRLARLANVDEKEAEEALRRAIILHDIGKASKSFQEYLKRLEELKAKYDEVKLKAPIRHELLSAYMAYVAFLGDLPENLRKAVARAIALHHQRRLLGKLKGDKYYRLTRKLFKAMARIDDELLDPGFVDNRPKALEIIRSYNPDEVLDKVLKDLREFGRNPYEKALVAIILDAIIESDRVATAYSSGNLKKEPWMPAYLEKVIEEGLEPIDFSISVHPLELKESEPEYVDIETPGYSPIRDSLFTLGFLQLVDRGKIISEYHKIIIKIPEKEAEKITEERIKALYYSALPIIRSVRDAGISALRGMPVLSKPIEESLIPIYQPLAPDVGGIYQKGFLQWDSGAKNLREYIESRLVEVSRKLGVKPKILSLLVGVGFAFYLSFFRHGNRVIAVYPIIKPGYYSVAELKYSLQTNLGERIATGENYLSYTALRDFVFSIASSLDLDELEFFIATYTTEGKQAALRFSFSISSLRLREFVVDLIRNLDRFGSLRYLTDVLNTAKKLIEIDPIATAEIAQGVNDLDLGALYRGVRGILTEVYNEASKPSIGPYELYRLSEFLEYTVNRVANKILEERGIKREIIYGFFNSYYDTLRSGNL